MKTRRLQFIKTTFLLATLLAISAMTYGSVNVNTVTVNSPPALSCSTTTVTASGTLSAANYIYNGTVFTVTGFNIVIDIQYIAGIIVLPAITPFSQAVSLGMLPTGTYTVTTNGRLNGTIQTSLVTTLVVGSCCPAVPGFTISDTSVCPGDSVHFTNTSTGVLNQFWYQNNVQVSTALNHATAITTPGTYDFKLVVDDGACSDSLTKQLVVNPFPTLNLGADTTFCEGTFAILDAGVRDSVLWSTAEKTRVILASTAGTYHVDVWEKGCMASDTVQLMEVANPIVNLGADTTLCEGDTLLLNATIPGLGTYLWQDFTLSPIYLATDAGTYRVIVTNEDGCFTIDEIVVGLMKCPTGREDKQNNPLPEIYPNPFSDRLTLRLRKGTVGTLVVLNLQGAQLITKSINGEEQVAIDFSTEFAKGVYFIQIDSNYGSSTSKVMLQR
jgi:hypothetical protein